MIKKILIGNAFSISWFPLKPNSIVSIPQFNNSEIYVYLVTPYKKIRILSPIICKDAIRIMVIDKDLLNSLEVGKYSLEVIWKKQAVNIQSYDVWSRVFKKNAFELTNIPEEANVPLNLSLSIYSFRI